jgi:hypothetical protein
MDTTSLDTYVAILSTATFVILVYLQFRDFWDRAPHLKVTCRLAIPTGQLSTLGPLLEITSLNEGPRPIEVKRNYIRLSDGQTLDLLYPVKMWNLEEDSIPKKLNYHERARDYYILPEIRRQLAELAATAPPVYPVKVCVLDASGKEYHTNILEDLKVEGYS